MHPFISGICALPQYDKHHVNSRQEKDPKMRCSCHGQAIKPHHNIFKSIMRVREICGYPIQVGSGFKDSRTVPNIATVLLLEVRPIFAVDSVSGLTSFSFSGCTMVLGILCLWLMAVCPTRLSFYSFFFFRFFAWKWLLHVAKRQGRKANPQRVTVRAFTLLIFALSKRERIG